MKQDIFLTEIKTKKKLQFSSTPNELTVTSETTYATYEILDLGQVQFPKGSAPEKIEWSGTFFGESRKDMPFIRKWEAPSTSIKTLEQWRAKGAPLKLVVTGTTINIDVTIASFTYTPTGGDGDYSYTISFAKFLDESVTVTKTKNTTTANTSKQETSTRPSQKSETHTVRYGDRLWNLAIKYYGSGSQYMKIYNANKSIIESTAKKHGYKSSNNGHWIFPGTVLTIP